MAVVGQTTPMNCGAACLLCAAIELKTNPAAGTLPASSPLATLISGGPPRETIPWINAIYTVSAAGGSGYSLPSGILQAAGYLGMDASVILAKSHSANLLQWKYPHEMANCQPHVDQKTTGKLGDLVLAANERALHCVRIGALPAVHWVLQRDDNSYMDPAGGPNSLSLHYGGAHRADRATLKSAGQSVFSYHGTGLAIKLTRQ